VMRMERPTQMPPFASICHRLYDEGKLGPFHSGFVMPACLERQRGKRQHTSPRKSLVSWSFTPHLMRAHIHRQEILKLNELLRILRCCPSGLYAIARRCVRTERTPLLVPAKQLHALRYSQI